MDNVIEHSNIVYLPTISELGGIETYAYELVKKYKDLDIAVVCKKCDEGQAKRIKKYCRLYIHTNQRIKCDVIITNYDTSIIDYVEEGAKIYQTIHADYTNPLYNGRIPSKNNRITSYIAITKFLEEKMKEALNVDNMLMTYNPLTIDDEEKPIVIVCASRLHKYKGKDRIQAFIDEMDRQKKNYLFIIISNETDGVTGDNVVFIKNRLDISKWLKLADYVCLFSDSEACSYTLNEALYRNIPILCTPLPYLKEIGVKDNENAYILEFDCSNVKDIVDKIEKIPKFNFKRLEDKYDKIFTKEKSKYQDYLNTRIKCKCIADRGYYDLELKKYIGKDEELPPIAVDRAEYLQKLKLIEIMGVINEERKPRNSKRKDNRSSE